MTATRPEAERPEAPRCGGCGRFMQVRNAMERAVVYECCYEDKTVFRPQFRRPDEVIR